MHGSEVRRLARRVRGSNWAETWALGQFVLAHGGPRLAADVVHNDAIEAARGQDMIACCLIEHWRFLGGGDSLLGARQSLANGPLRIAAAVVERFPYGVPRIMMESCWTPDMWVQAGCPSLSQQRSAAV